MKKRFLIKVYHLVKFENSQFKNIRKFYTYEELESYVLQQAPYNRNYLYLEAMTIIEKINLYKSPLKLLKQY